MTDQPPVSQSMSPRGTYLSYLYGVKTNGMSKCPLHKEMNTCSYQEMSNGELTALYLYGRFISLNLDFCSCEQGQLWKTGVDPRRYIHEVPGSVSSNVTCWHLTPLPCTNSPP